MKRAARIVARFTAIVCAILLLTAAMGCQPTPQQPVVANKSDLQSMIAQTPAPVQKYEAPSLWQEAIPYDAGNLALYLDAPIQVPDTDVFPVVSVQSVQLSQEQADQALRLLVGDVPLYMIKTVLTKQELEEEILRIQKGIADPDSDLNQGKAADPEGYQELLEQLQSEIAALKEQQKDAPDTYNPQPVSLQFASGKEKLASVGNLTPEQLDGITEFLVIEGQADLGKSTPAMVSISSGEMRLNNKIDFTDFNANCALYGEVRDQTEGLNGIALTKEEAIEAATEAVRALGLTDYTLAAIGSDAMITPGNLTVSNGYEVEPKCYCLYFTHEVSKIPVTFVSSYKHTSNSSVGQQYSSPWPDEVLKVVVDDTGIINLAWHCPYSVADTVAQNTALKPFNEIQSIFKEQIKVHGIWDINPEIIKREIHINQIVLGMAKIPKMDDPEASLLVPAWDFFGYSVYQYDGQQPGGYRLDENNQYTEKGFMHSFLTINAIDGSVIQRDQSFYQD